MNIDEVHEFADTLLSRLGLEEDVGIRMVLDDEMSRMNSLYRGIENTTDVLSFASAEGEPMPNMSEYLGDIVVSVERAALQAHQCGHTLNDEIAILMVHGILHLLDYDHERSIEEAREMAELEMGVLSGLGRNPLSALLGRSF